MASVGTVGQAAGERHGALHQFLVRPDLVDEADARGLRRVDGVARPQQLQRLRRAHQPGQPVGAAGAGREPDLDVGLGETGGGPGEAQVHRQREIEAGTDGGAVDRRDHRLVRVGEGERDAVDMLADQRPLLRRRALQPLPHQLLDVAAAAEGLAGSGHHHHVHVRAHAAVGERGGPGVDHGAGEGVAPLGPVEGDGRDPVGDLQAYLIAHGPAPSIAALPSPAATMAGQSAAPPPRAACAPSTCHQWASLPHSSRQAQRRVVQWCRSCSAV